MKIEGYGVILYRLDETRLELIRNWRNSDYVSNRMLYNKYITEEEQKAWFEKINNDKNYYFIVEFNNQYVGVINVKNIENNSGEQGMYLINDSFENTDVVSRMLVCFNEFVFDQLKLDSLYSRNKKDNKNAISLSLAQGCVYDENDINDEYFKFILYPAIYEKKIKKIKKILNQK